MDLACQGMGLTPFVDIRSGGYTTADALVDVVASLNLTLITVAGFVDPVGL
jgi:hypothetical protein